MIEYSCFSFLVQGPKLVDDSSKSGFESEWLQADIIFESKNSQEVKPLKLLLHSELMGFYYWLKEVEISLLTRVPVEDYEFVEPIKVALIRTEDNYFIELWFLYLYEDTREHRKARVKIDSPEYFKLKLNLEAYLNPSFN